MRVEVEAGAVVADGVSADGWWGVFELLRDIFDQCLAVHAQEGATHLQSDYKDNDITDTLNITIYAPQLSFGFLSAEHFWMLPHTTNYCSACVDSYQFRVYWVCPHHLTTDPHQGADAHG